MAGAATGEQIVAANVDTIFLVSSLNQELNLRRIERYLTVIWDAGAVPVLILNKLDLCPNPLATLQLILTRLPHVEAHTVSAWEGTGLEAISAHLLPGRTSLANRLLGYDALKVQGIREGDDRGKHTTTSRELLELPSGALLIDTPGMRELHLWESDEGVDQAFDEIAELTRRCRFVDCTHSSEPSCAILGAIDAGRLDRDRFENYLKLRKESDFQHRKVDKAAAAAEKKKWKRLHLTHRVRDRGRDRNGF